MLDQPQDRRTLRIQAFFLCLFLAIQYALGMYVNLFVSFPHTTSGTTIWEFSWSQLPLAAHIVLGILLLVGSVIAVARAIRYREARWVVVNSIAFLAILIAGASGAMFVGTQAGIFSYLMSLAFLAAILSYGWGLLAR